MADAPLTIEQATVRLGKQEPKRWRGVIIVHTADGRRYRRQSVLLANQDEAHRWKNAWLVSVWTETVDLSTWSEIDDTDTDDQGFGYWAGPRHEAEGGGYSGVPSVSRPTRLVTGIDRDGYGEIYTYVRRPVSGEWRG